MNDLEYIYVFSEGNSYKWLKKGFRHCFALARLNKDVWIFSENTHGGTYNGVITNEGVRELLSQEGYIAVYKKNPLQKKKIGLSCLIPTCVSYTKMFTNFGKFCITPFGLYKQLLNNGGIQWEWEKIAEQMPKEQD